MLILSIYGNQSEYYLYLCNNFQQSQNGIYAWITNYGCNATTVHSQQRPALIHYQIIMDAKQKIW